MKYFRIALIQLLTISGLKYYIFNYNNGEIYYDNISYSDNVVFNGVDGVNIDYTASFNEPGDYYELYFDVVNSTNYDVEIKDCIYNSDDDYIDYELTYQNGNSIDVGDIIKKGNSIHIKYKVLYKDYIDNDNYTFDTSFSILYEQVL